MKSHKKIVTLEGELEELESKKRELKDVLKALEDEAVEIVKRQKEIRVSMGVKRQLLNDLRVC